jgi:hypothetical protein
MFSPGIGDVLRAAGNQRSLRDRNDKRSVMASFPCHSDLIMRTSDGGACLRGAGLPSWDSVSVWICRWLCNLLAPVPQSQEKVDLALSPTPVLGCKRIDAGIHFQTGTPQGDVSRAASRSPDWVKFKNPAARFGVEEDCGR